MKKWEGPVARFRGTMQFIREQSAAIAQESLTTRSSWLAFSRVHSGHAIRDRYSNAFDNIRAYWIALLSLA